MAKKRGKAVSFDAMVKFFMRNYDIPTKKDVELLVQRLDRIEDLIRKTAGVRGRAPKSQEPVVKAQSASDRVLGVVVSAKDGVGISDIKASTGYDDKKLRNIVFRLHSLGRIKRKSRGVYIAA